MAEGPKIAIVMAADILRDAHIRSCAYHQRLFVSDVYLPALFPAGQPFPEPSSGWGQGLRERLPTFDWEVK